jgi:hypothetical protein
MGNNRPTLSARGSPSGPSPSRSISEQIQEVSSMNRISPILFVLSIAVAGSSVVAAQQTTSIPKVLQITREYLKPYKNGTAHDKTESAFLTAMNKAKFPAYYVGLNSLSGKSRALYLTQYDSFATWEKDNKIVDKNPTLAGEIERASVADGELLDSVDSAVYTYDEGLSYHPHADISVFKVRGGHREDFEKLTKMVKEGHEKAGTSAHWATFEIAYGTEDGTYIVLSGDKSMADIDTGFSEGKKFRDALGDEGMKKLDELFASTVESSRSELFSINPRQSYVSEDWIKADPDFWKPKAAAPKAAAEKEKKP